MGNPLWAPWRMEYILAPKDKSRACIFCDVAGAPPDERRERHVVATTDHAFVMLNRYPFAAGHLLIVPHAHVEGLEALAPDTHDELFRLVRESATRLRRALRAEALNVGLNLGAAAGAGVAEHLHVHIVPRWSGDTNFMPVLADARVVPQALEETRQHLLPFLRRPARAARWRSARVSADSDSTTPPAGPLARMRHLFLGGSAALVLAVIIAARQVLLPFVLALVVAYVLLPAVRRVERARVPRWIAILLVYAVTLGLLGTFVSTIIPRLVAEGRGLAAEWPRFNAVARDEWLPAIDRKLGWSGKGSADAKSEAAPPIDEAPKEKPAPFKLVKQPDGSFDVRVADDVIFHERREGVWQIERVEKTRVISSAQLLRDAFDKGTAYVQENSVELINIGQRVVVAVSSGIFTLFMTLMLGAYMMLTHEKIFAFFRELWAPSSRASFDRFLRRLDRGLSGVVRGQLLICLVNGALSAIGFSLFGLKYWPILAIVAAVMSLIPIFGSILSSIPAVAIGLTQSPGTALGVLAWILGIHQLEANFLNPKIIGDSAKIHPVLVVFSLIVGEHFFQLAGALFAVPAMSIAQTIFLHLREVTMGLGDPLASVPPAIAPAAPDVPSATRTPEPSA